jgi:glycosyltransferase involved in cell wall biosynthesis
MREWARRCERLIVAPAGVERAVALLDVPRERMVPLPNGADVEVFRPREIDRSAFWRSVLVDDPQGWLPGQSPGSARYEPADVARLARGVVLLYVGRFTAVKRVDLLVGAFVRAQERFATPAGLVLVGGHPGEWEGEHPLVTVRRLDARHVFLAGWRAHDQLPQALNAADVLVLPSVAEAFGLALVEAMACGLPVIACDAHGPAEIVDDGESGWLIPPDDEQALAAAMIEAAADPNERHRRGQQAASDAHHHYGWPAIATRIADLYQEVIATGTPAGGRLVIR